MPLAFDAGVIDFLSYLCIVLLVAILIFSAAAIKIRRSGKAVTVKNLTGALRKVRDDPNEPAKWIP
jgi:cytochrome c biogenesis protein CcdA